MPCRCCCAVGPSKGMQAPYDEAINQLLKAAASLIRKYKLAGCDDTNDAIEAWQEAFEHHLRGCPEKCSQDSS